MIADRMRSAASAAAVRDAAGMHAAIERFLKASRRPHLLEPGEELLPLTEGGYVIELLNGRLRSWNGSPRSCRRSVVKAGACAMPATR